MRYLLHKPVDAAEKPLLHVQVEEEVKQVDCETQLVEPEVQAAPALISKKTNVYTKYICIPFYVLRMKKLLSY